MARPVTAPLRRLALAGAACLLLAGGVAAAQDGGLEAAIGKALFRRAWVPAPSSTRANDGLGPLFDARSCAACHPGAGAGATAIDATGTPQGLGLVLTLLRADGSGDPVYGHRMETMTLPGVPAEGVIHVETGPEGRRLASIAQPGYGALDPATGISLRAAPDLRGRAALERVSDATILAIEAEQAKDGKGVRGRARRLATPEGRSAIGRFGWKASHSTLEGQASEAFSLDLGLSTPMRLEPWGDCTVVQTACRAAYQGNDAEGEPEIAPSIVQGILVYLHSLKPPEREDDVTPAGRREAARGVRLFASTGCAMCHRPELATTDGGRARLFTDVLLHDMGPGLADPVAQPGAEPSQWRTAPLAGLSAALERGTGLLHDGRASSVAEALHWHQGEAAGARARFDALNDADRHILLNYVSSL
ncbi:thiol oxidoreductase [Ancylobacter sp. 6x-1]|uniref:Thiol oxidoreductase n=1 Tax=Ancylobacter crimeensis TaxID=2579147 RepID=A0ABT0D6E5_9HYPH|nr:di-heme oxidoredictase family protein [Ancylobacter crimeensis]MCK0195521.1 thiol oxidoreductase [Ancylobacter crimeensis]